jgi:hypothetical protein
MRDAQWEGGRREREPDQGVVPRADGQEGNQVQNALADIHHGSVAHDDTAILRCHTPSDVVVLASDIINN